MFRFQLFTIYIYSSFIDHIKAFFAVVCGCSDSCAASKKGKVSIFVCKSNLVTIADWKIAHTMDLHPGGHLLPGVKVFLLDSCQLLLDSCQLPAPQQRPSASLWFIAIPSRGLYSFVGSQFQPKLCKETTKQLQKNVKYALISNKTVKFYQIRCKTFHTDDRTKCRKQVWGHWAV